MTSDAAVEGRKIRSSCNGFDRQPIAGEQPDLVGYIGDTR